MAVTEHSQDMSEGTLAELEARSRKLTTSDFLVVPGMEFTCAGTIHILGLGVTRLCSSEDPSTVIEHIHALEGLAVLAHPSSRAYPIDPAWVARLDGCEIWNNRQGKWLPQLHAVRRFRELSRHAPGLWAYAGLDLHGPDGYSYLAMKAVAKTVRKPEILTALREGRYVLGNSYVTIPAAGTLSASKAMYLALTRSALNGIRRVRDLVVRSAPEP
jgi:hypothetical protein